MAALIRPSTSMPVQRRSLAHGGPANGKEMYDELIRLRESESQLKQSVKALTDEVRTLKARLHELRKAKMQTAVVRRQSEPFLFSPVGSSGGSGCGEIGHFQKLQRQAEELREQMKQKEQEWQQKEEDLQKQHQEEMKRLREEKPLRPSTARGELLAHAQKEILRLREIVADLRARQRDTDSGQAELLETNQSLKSRINALLEELNQKEAHWNEREEQLVAEVRTSWQEKYDQWMKATERKIEELQRVNMSLRQIVNQRR